MSDAERKPDYLFSIVSPEFCSAQGNVLGGFGIYAGGGVQYAGGIAQGPHPTGISSGTSTIFEGDYMTNSIGLQVDDPLGSSVSGGVSGRMGGGIGIFAGAGKSKSINLSTRPLGC